MSYVEFIKLVRDIRAAQKAYFSKRGGDELREAKRLEKEVDRVVADDPAQGKLFGEGDE